MDGTGGGFSVRPREGFSGTLQAELELRMLREMERGREVWLLTWFGGAVVGREGDMPRNRETKGGGAAESWPRLWLTSCDTVES
jgi:hypothetical protein